EYFATAFKWILRNLSPKDNFIAVAGLSRGGELAMLLGAYFPDYVSAVIGYAPSSVVHGVLRVGRPGETRDATAWTWQGEALPNVWRNNPEADWTAFDVPSRSDKAIRQVS